MASSLPPPAAFASPASTSTASPSTATATATTGAPAGAAAAEPVKALDPIAEPDILDKAIGIAKPYYDKVDEAARPLVEKVALVTRPYTDAVAAKTKEFIHNLEGHPEGVKEAPVATATTSTSAAALDAHNAAESGVTKAGNILEQGISSVQNTFNQLGHTIDEKTADQSGKGLLTRLTESVEKGFEKVDHLLDQQPALGTNTAAPPVQTTTNSVPRA